MVNQHIGNHGLGIFWCGQIAYNLLIIGPKGLQCETNLLEIMLWKSSDVIRFDLEPLIQGQMRTAKC